MLLKSDGTAAACGVNGFGKCDVPALETRLAYTVRLFGRDLRLQASLDGGSVQFVSLGGVKRCRILAEPGATLAKVYDQLVAEHVKGRPGPGIDRADAVLPDGRLSKAPADETVAAAFST